MKKNTKKKITEKMLDDAFSLFIRARDGRCVRCGKTTGLTNSHFYTRTARSVRFDPDNCDALCWMPCHTYLESRKNGEYTDFKKKQLGVKRFNELRRRYYTQRPRPPTEIEKREMLERWRLSPDRIA